MLLQLPDPEIGWQFRKDIYAHLGMKLPAVPTQKVLFWLRPPLKKNRGFANAAALLEIAKKYNIEYTYVHCLIMECNMRTNVMGIAATRKYAVFLMSFCACPSRVRIAFPTPHLY